MADRIRYYSFFLLVLFFIFPGLVQAEIRTIESTIRQPFSGSLSPDEARLVATVKARRQALTIAGDYMESLPVVKRKGIVRDQLPVLAAGVLKTDVVSQNNFVTEDGFAFEVVVKVSVDTETLEAETAKLLNDSARFDEYQAVRQRETALLADFEKLSKEIRQIESAETEKAGALKTKMQNTTSALSSLVWYNKALDLARHQPLDDRTTDQIIRALQTAVKDDPENGPAFLWLGRLYSKKQMYDRAVVCYQKALEGDLKTLGENHPDLAAAYNRLGLALHRNGDYDRAVEAYMRAWKIQIQTLGESHPDVATTYNNLGEAYREKGDFDRAIEYYNKDLEICLDTLGENHINVATSYNNLAYAYHGKNDIDRAIEYFNKALNVYKAVLGENHPQTKTINENIDFLKNQP